MEYRDGNSFVSENSLGKVRAKSRQAAVNSMIKFDNEMKLDGEFISFMRTYNHVCKNKQKGKQRLNGSFRKELYEVRTDFGPEKGKEIIYALNRIGQAGVHNHYDIYQNLNSHSFVRGTNYSFSLIDGEDNTEIAIVGFFPCRGKILEIVQIQGQQGYKVTKEDFASLIQSIKIFAEQYGFEKLRVLRGEKNFNYVSPVCKPKNLEKHQESLFKIYTRFPLKYRGFVKDEESEWYSYYYI